MPRRSLRICRRLYSALNSRGKAIHAEDATRGERYQCAECKVRVILNQGNERVAHFKHFPASASDHARCERCYLYITDRGGSPQAAAPPKQRVRPLARVVLAVGWKKNADGPERWSLYASVPFPPPSVEHVWVEGNINGEQWIPRRAVEKDRHVPVRVEAKQYSCRYRQAGTFTGTHLVVQPSAPLERDRANVFAAGTGGGAQLEQDQPLVRGRCYFALAKKSEIWRPPPGNTSRAINGSKDCDSKGAWDGHLIYVPITPRRDFDTWCQAVCKRKVIAPPADIELAYPPFIDIRPDGTLVVPPGEMLIFALQGEWDEPEIEIWRDATATSPTVERLSVFEGDLFALRHLSAGLYSIYATESSRVLMRIEVADNVEPILPAFTIRTEDRATGTQLSSELHSPDGAARWSGLLSGSEVWIGIDFPAGWPVEFVCRLLGESHNRCHDSETPAGFASLVGECLAAEPVSASVDAGVFGKAHWEAAKLAPPVEQGRKAIPREVRDRLLWLLTNAAKRNGVKTLPLGIASPPAWESRLMPKDFAMVAKFLKAPRWPEALLAHARAMARTLSDHLKT